MEQIMDVVTGISKTGDFLSNIDPDSIIGIVIVLLVIGLIGSIAKKAAKGVAFVLSCMVVIEAGYFLGLSKLDAYIPFSSIFKKDIIVMAATYLPGTKLSYAVLYIRGIIVAFIDKMVAYI